MAKLVDVLTPVTPLEVFDALRVSWQARFGTAPARSSLLVLLSQWALETGRGKSMHCYNFGNVKSNGTSGDWCFFRCNEIIGGKVVWFEPDHPACRFRAFTTLQAGADDYLSTLHRRFTRAWPAVVEGNPAAFSHLLRAQGYYTANEAQYTATLTALFREFDRHIGVPTDANAPPNLYSIAGLQRALAALGFDPGTIDGQDGDDTRAAVRGFQLAHGLVPDGKSGPLTRAAILDAWKARQP